MSRERSRSPRRGDALSWQPWARPVRQLYTVYSFQYLVIRPCPPPEDYDEYHVVNVQARGLLGPQGESFARREAEVYIRPDFITETVKTLESSSCGTSSFINTRSMPPPRF